MEAERLRKTNWQIHQNSQMIYSTSGSLLRPVTAREQNRGSLCFPQRQLAPVDLHGNTTHTSHPLSPSYVEI